MKESSKQDLGSTVKCEIGTSWVLRQNTARDVDGVSECWASDGERPTYDGHKYRVERRHEQVVRSRRPKAPSKAKQIRH